VIHYQQKKINFADQIRTIRALEVFYVTGKPLSTLKVQNRLTGEY